jgi:hypothetical protein
MTPWSPLRIESIGNGRFELLEPLTHVYYYKSRWCRTVVPKGYVTDFWSIPRIFRPLLDVSGDGCQYAVEHDWHGSADLIPRRDANILLRQNCILDGRFAPWKCNAIYAGVQIGALYIRDSARSVCQNRALAGLFSGDPCTVDPKTVPRPLWMDGICKQQEAFV